MPRRSERSAAVGVGGVLARRRAHSSLAKSMKGVEAIIEMVDVAALSERTTMGVFFRQAEKLGERVILRYWRDEGWQELTWSGMRRSALAIAAHLVELGVKPGDRVVL